MPIPKRSSITWILVTAALLVVALFATGTPGASADAPGARSSFERVEPVGEASTLAADAVDEAAATPGVCPVFCSTDAFCNAGCPNDSLCRNSRCVQF